MTHEVEIKVEVTSGDIKRVTGLLGGKIYSRLTETDIYFTSKHRDLIQTEECVRIRLSDKVRELTWKPPTTAAMKGEQQFWKQELNVPIGGDIDDWLQMMNRLDFVEYVVVKKERTYFEYDEQTSVMIDVLDGAGYFVEIETNSPDSEASVRKNRLVLTILGLDKRNVVNIPYRDLVARRRGTGALS